MSKRIRKLSNGTINTVVDERKQELRELKPLLPVGWTSKYIEKFHSKLKGIEVIKKYKRIQNISDGKVAADKIELVNIKSLIVK